MASEAASAMGQRSRRAGLLCAPSRRIQPVPVGRRIKRHRAWAKASAGQRNGPSGTKMGNASLTWAFAEAAALFQRQPPEAQQSRANREQKPGQSQAWTL